MLIIRILGTNARPGNCAPGPAALPATVRRVSGAPARNSERRTGDRPAQPCRATPAPGVMCLRCRPRRGVADAAVGGTGLAVDAVGVDLEQDGDAVPGAAGDLGGGHAGV